MKEIIISIFDNIKPLDLMYGLSIIGLTFLTLKFLFKITPKWFKRLVAFFWSVVLGVIWYVFLETSPPILLFIYVASMFLYQYVLRYIRKLLKIDYDDGGLI